MLGDVRHSRDMNDYGINEFISQYTRAEGAINATLSGQIFWDGKPVIDDDDGGTSGVREPRRPRPTPLAPAAMAFSFA